MAGYAAGGNGSGVDPMAPLAVRSRYEQLSDADRRMRIGPLDKLYLIWLNGGSCDGCTVAVVGATKPPVENLLAGVVPGLPKVELVHTLVAMESGADYIENLAMAERGELDAPYVIVWEGTIFDEDAAGDGYFFKLGEDASGRPMKSRDWLRRLAPGAAAVIAIGTCATWGGIPASIGNPTGSMGVMDYLGLDFRSLFGVPVVNIPGCSPVGDNFMDVASAVLLFLQGLGPLPEFDELGRPAWLFGETVHRHCPRAGYYEEGVFATRYGHKECLVELGCWGPVVQCNISERGMVNGTGGCMNIGGICIGCTMPGFPDKFSPIYTIAPGSMVSSTTSKIVGGFIRRMRRLSMSDKNLSAHWEGDAGVSSGWARFQHTPDGAAKFVHRIYRTYQHSREANGEKKTFHGYDDRIEYNRAFNKTSQKTPTAGGGA